MVGFLAPWAVALTAPLGYLWSVQDSMIFPERHKNTPVAAWGRWSLGDVEVEGIGKISFLFSDPLPPSTEPVQPGVQPRPVILFLHGNGNSADISALMCSFLVEAGYPVVAAEYPGYAGNPGAPSEGSLRAAAVATASWSRGKWQGRGLVVIGESIGSSPAVHLAASGLADGLVLDSPFTSMNATISALMPWLPFVGTLNRHPMDNLDAIEKAGDRLPPSLTLISSSDPIVPTWMGEAIARTAPSGKIYRSPMPGHPVLGMDSMARKSLLEFLASQQARVP